MLNALKNQSQFHFRTNAMYNAKLHAWYPTEIKDTNGAQSTEVLYKVATEGLFPLNGLKERFEVAGAKTREVVSLDDFNEDGGAIHQVLFSLLA